MWTSAAPASFRRARELLQFSRRALISPRRSILSSSDSASPASRAAAIFFSWRHFRNGKEVGALAGLAPTPYQSGDSEHELGISRAGNRWVRGLAIEIAWGWLRHQPDSALTHWYNERFARGGPRARKVGIVALARKLLVALWRYVETGALPEGAVLKV